MVQGVKQLPLKRPDTCTVCAVDLPVGTVAWWDSTAKTVTCVGCHGTPKVAAIDVGTPGLGAQREYERRVAKRERAIEAKYGTGRIGRFVKFISDEPQSTTAWAKGSKGEVLLGSRLNERMADIGVVLHDRRIAGKRSNIDHIVVATSGVWVIDAKRYSGTVERRLVGSLFNSEDRLYVNNRDQTKLLDGVRGQVDAVQDALQSDETVPVRGCLCFVDTEWGWFAKPFTMRDVLVTWPAKLYETMLQPGQLSTEDVHRVAHQLGARLAATR
jgi:hypothetical protein